MLSSLLFITLFCCHVYGYNDDITSNDVSLRLYRNYYDFETGNIEQPLSRKQKRRKKLKKSAKKVLKAATTVITLPTTIASMVCKRTSRAIQTEIANNENPMITFMENEAQQIRNMLKAIGNVPRHTRQAWFDWKISFVELIITRYLDGGLKLMDHDIAQQFMKLQTKISDHSLKSSKKKYRRGQKVKDEEWKLTQQLLHEEESQLAERSTAKAIMKRLENAAHCVWSATLILTKNLKTFTINTIMAMKPWIIGLLKASFKCGIRIGWNQVKRRMATSVEVDFNAYDYQKFKQSEAELLQSQRVSWDTLPLMNWLVHWMKQGAFDEAVEILNSVFNVQMAQMMKDVDDKLDAYFEDKAEGTLVDCLRQWLKSEVKQIVQKEVLIIKKWLPKIFNHAKESIAGGFELKYDRETMDVARHIDN